jgi:hypothetical protein
MTVKIIAGILIAITLSACGEPPENPEYAQYNAMCHNRGGVVSVVGVGWQTVTYVCVGEGGELLPRFSK